MRSNRKSRSLRANRRVKSSKSLKGGMRLRSKSIRKTQSAKKTRSLRKSKTNRKSKSSRRTRRRRNMKGGFVEYSPLPCFLSDGKHMDPDTRKEVHHHKYDTNWESKHQFGKEICVSPGTEGAENDPKAKQFGFDLEGLAYENTSDKLSPKQFRELLRAVREEAGFLLTDRDAEAGGRFERPDGSLIEATPAQRWFETRGEEWQAWRDDIGKKYGIDSDIHKLAQDLESARSQEALRQIRSSELNFTESQNLSQAKDEVTKYIVDNQITQKVDTTNTETAGVAAGATA